MKHRVLKIIFVYFSVLSVLSVPKDCYAQQLSTVKAKSPRRVCIVNGEIVIRKKCLKKEIPLTPSNSNQALKVVEKNGPAGPKGPTGPKGTQKGDRGPQGENGDQGERGFSGERGGEGVRGSNGLTNSDPMESGEGAFGSIGGDFDTPDQFGTRCETIALNRPLALSPGNTFIVADVPFNLYCQNRMNFDNSCCHPDGASGCGDGAVRTSEITTHCPGTVNNPSAVAGSFCFYVAYLRNANRIRVSIGGSQVTICWDFDGDYVAPFSYADTFVHGVFAYTAP